MSVGVCTFATMSARIPPLALTFDPDRAVPAPSALESTLQDLTGLRPEFVVARIDKATFEQAAAHSPLDLNWGLGEDGYFDRIAIAHEAFATSIRLSLTPAYQSARLDVPIFRDYLWWMTLRALHLHGASAPQQAMDLPTWTAYRWDDPQLPPAVTHLRELHEQKFNLVAKLLEHPAYQNLPEEELNRRMEEEEAKLEAAFYAKYGPLPS